MTNEVAALSLLICSYFAPIETDLGHSVEARKLHRMEVKQHRLCMREWAPQLINTFGKDCNGPSRYDVNRMDYDTGTPEECSTIK